MTRTLFRRRASLRTDRPATSRFYFADAFWFRLPLKVLVVGLTTFALLCLYPALSDESFVSHLRLALAFASIAGFIGLASIFAVSVNDGCVDVGPEYVDVAFEWFFRTRIPLADIVSVADIHPRPKWRYSFGLSTNFHDRIACSHGGTMVEIVLSRPQPTRLWPRHLAVTRFWLAVREHDQFVELVRELAPRSTKPQLQERLSGDGD